MAPTSTQGMTACPKRRERKPMSFQRSGMTSIKRSTQRDSRSYPGRFGAIRPLSCRGLMRSICEMLMPGRARPNRKQSTVAENKAENQTATETIVIVNSLQKRSPHKTNTNQGEQEGNEMFQDIMDICVWAFEPAGPSSTQRWPSLPAGEPCGFKLPSKPNPTNRSVNAHFCGDLERTLLHVLWGHELLITPK